MNKKSLLTLIFGLTALLVICTTIAETARKNEKDLEALFFRQEHSLFEDVLLCGSRTRSSETLAAGKLGSGDREGQLSGSSSAKTPSSAVQEVRLHRLKEGKWAAYLPADLSSKMYVSFSRFQALRLDPAEESSRNGQQSKARTLRSGDVFTYDMIQDIVTRDGGAENGGDGKAADDLTGAEETGNSCTLHAEAVGRDGSVQEEAEIIFYLAKDVPTLYLTTASGSMESVNEDKSIREEGRYVFYTQDGKKDVSGKCRIHGRGNSSWKEDKKQYSLNLASERSVLGMESSAKFALIANHSDASCMRNKTAFDLARLSGMPSSPESVFVNVYFNGSYNGLYLLAERPNARGGSVRIADLETANREADKGEASGGKAVISTEDGMELHASDRTSVPDNISGGYLLEMDGRYEKEDYWFSTVRHHFVVKYPEEIPLGEGDYISQYVREAEKAFYSADGLNPDTGKAWDEYMDRDSWVRMYMLQDFLVQWDVESFSFFVYKDADDPLLYCGPVWDFDLSMGQTALGKLPNVTEYSMWLRDHREGWLTQLMTQPEFAPALLEFAENEFFPALENYLEGDDEDSFSAQTGRLRSSQIMDCSRWGEKDDKGKSGTELLAWLRGRSAFWQGYAKDPSSYCTLTFRYGFADMDIYVPRGEALGFVPTEEYGEHLYGSFRRKYGEIAGWADEEGQPLTAQTVVEEDRIYLPQAP